MHKSLLSVTASLGLLAGCAPSTQLATTTPACLPSTPGATVRIDSTNVRGLAGIFEVLLINSKGSWGAAQTRLWLTLEPTDSTPTQRIGIFPGPRPLQGKAVYESTTRTDSVPTVMIGLKLYLGGFDMVDGGGDELTVTDFTARGFRGTWEYEGGIAIAIDTTTGRRIPDPKGIFCATRL